MHRFVGELDAFGYTWSGLLVLSFSAMMKDGGKTFDFFVVLVLLGGFGSIIDNYVPL